MTDQDIHRHADNIHHRRARAIQCRVLACFAYIRASEVLVCMVLAEHYLGEGGRWYGLPLAAGLAVLGHVLPSALCRARPSAAPPRSSRWPWGDRPPAAFTAWWWIFLGISQWSALAVATSVGTVSGSDTRASTVEEHVVTASRQGSHGTESAAPVEAGRKPPETVREAVQHLAASHGMTWDAAMHHLAQLGARRVLATAPTVAEGLAIASAVRRTPRPASCPT